jgi:hypothetical protein
MLRELPRTIDEIGWATDRGELRIRRPTPLVLVFIEKGYLDADFAPSIISANDEAVLGGMRPHIFVDCESLEGYAPPVRTEPTKWLQRNHKRVVRQHMLVRSAVVKMGLSIASLTLGGIVSGYTDRRAFDAALEDAVVKTRRPSGRTSLR